MMIKNIFHLTSIKNMYQESGHGLNNNSLHRTASLAICVKSNLESESYI